MNGLHRGVGLINGTTSAFADVLGQRMTVVPEEDAAALLLVLPFGARTARTSEALGRFWTSTPDVPVVGCVWTIEREDRLAASFSVDSSTALFENHARFLTAWGWEDALAASGGDKVEAAVEYAARSAHIMSQSSNESHGGTNPKRVLAHLAEVGATGTFLVAKAYGSDEWHGIEPALAYLQAAWPEEDVVAAAETVMDPGEGPTTNPIGTVGRGPHVKPIVVGIAVAVVLMLVVGWIVAHMMGLMP